MKSSIRKSIYILLGLSVLLVTVACNQEVSSFQVNDVVSDPGAFSGSLRVEGVVYAYAQADSTIVGVMDKKELQCTTPNCNKVLLPVKFTENRPRIGDEIVVTGAMTKEEWGYLLQAEQVQVLTNHKLGGV